MNDRMIRRRWLVEIWRQAMKYYIATINEGSEVVIIHARNQFVAKALINEDAESIKVISAMEAKKLIKRGFRLVS